MASHERSKAVLEMIAIFGGLAVSSLAGALIGGEAAYFAMHHNFISPDYFLHGSVTSHPEFRVQGIGSALGMSGYMGGLMLLYSRRRKRI